MKSITYHSIKHLVTEDHQQGIAYRYQISLEPFTGPRSPAWDT